MPPMTLDMHASSGSQTTADSSTGSRCVDVIQPASQHISGSAPTVGGGAGIPGHGGTSQPALPLRVADDIPLGRVDENTPPPSVQAASLPRERFSQPPAVSNVVGAVAANHIPEHYDGEDTDRVAALTAVAEAVVRQITAAAAPLILASTDNVQEPAGVDTAREHVSATTL